MCKTVTLIAKHLGTRNNRLLKEGNWTKNTSEKLSGASSENEKQRIYSSSGIKKKTKGYSSGKCGAHNMQQSWVATTINKYDAISMINLFLVLLHLQLYRTCVMMMTHFDIQCKQLKCIKINCKIVPLI